ncbi:multicopper oxidase family protein [Dongia sp.]|uniref:multicopper oxidase family protein n=1 Tax=Dongia sp. TaxID=1977262 RepID=UPI0037525F03
MSTHFSSALTRRRLLLAGAGLVVAAPASIHAAVPSVTRLVARKSDTALAGVDRPSTEVWAYDGRVPGPTLRLRQGEPAELVVENRLDEETTVHWHGIRLPIAMDGVPGISQRPIKPGESFTYSFTPPDAGTFWYHPHANSLQQLGRGLAGALIVEEAAPIAVDRDLSWMVSDWRLRADGGMAPGFGNPMEAAMSGRVGNLVTVNGVAGADQPVRAGERIRLRLINASLARIMALRIEGHRPVVVAFDGQPCEPHAPEMGRLLLGPAMRIDVIIDLDGEPGRRYAVVDDFYDGLAYDLTHLAYSQAAALPRRSTEPPVLPPNPLPEPDLAAADQYALKLQGGMMGGGAMNGMGGMSGMTHAAWAINGMSTTGDGSMDMPPLLTLKRMQTVVLSLINETAWWHPMHLHGHSFRILRRNGIEVPHRQWGDTVLLAPKDRVDCAFVADNPGEWMFHCHVMDHQMTGLMTILRVS